MALIDSLRNKEGTIVYPKTVTKAIYDYETMQTLEQTIDAKFGAEDVIPVENGGIGNKINESAQSVKLTTPRVIQINLGLEDDQTTFDGTEDITLGVTGVLPTSHGGTGVTSDTALNNLVYSTINNLGTTFTDYHDLLCGTYQVVYGALKENDPFTNTGSKRVSIIVWQGQSEASSERFILAVCIDGAQSGTAFIGHRYDTGVSWFSLLSQTNYGDYIDNYLSAGGAGQNYAFRNLNLNSINFDDVFDYNYVAAFSSKSSDYGTFPASSGTWNQVMNFYSTHFIVQQMVTVQQSTSADRSNLMWIRQRYASSGSVWSNWTYIGEGSNPNLLINGDFQVWQRGESFSAIGQNVYTADRWASGPFGGGMNIDVAHVTNDDKFGNVLKITVHGTGIINFGQFVEIPNGQYDAITISFWAKTSSTKTINFTVGDGSRLDNSFSSWGAANCTTEWQKFEYTYTNVEVTNRMVNATIARASGFDGGEIYIANAQLVMGNVAGEYIRPYAEGLAMCRYYFLDVGSSMYTGMSNITGNRIMCGILNGYKMRTDPTLEYTLGWIRSDGKDVSADGAVITYTNETKSIDITGISTTIIQPHAVLLTSLKLDAEIYP